MMSRPIHVTKPRTTSDTEGHMAGGVTRAASMSASAHHVPKGEVMTSLFPNIPQLNTDHHHAFLQVLAQSRQPTPGAANTTPNNGHHNAHYGHNHNHNHGHGHPKREASAPPNHGHHHNHSISHLPHTSAPAPAHGHSLSIAGIGHLSPHPPPGPPPPLGSVKVPRAHSVGSATAANPPGRPQSAGHTRTPSNASSSGTASPNGSTNGKPAKKKIGYPSAPGPINIRELIPVDLPAARSERSRSSPGPQPDQEPQPDPDVFSDFPITVDDVMGEHHTPGHGGPHMNGLPSSPQPGDMRPPLMSSAIPAGAVTVTPLPAHLAAALTLPPNPSLLPSSSSLTSSTVAASAAGPSYGMGGMEPPRARAPYMPPTHGHGTRAGGGMVSSSSSEDMDLWASFDMQFRTPAPLSQTMSPSAGHGLHRPLMAANLPQHSPGGVVRAPYSLPVSGIPPHSPSGDFPEFMHMRTHSLSVDHSRIPSSPSPPPDMGHGHGQMPSMLMLAGGHPPLAPGVPNGYHIGSGYPADARSPHYPPQPSYDGGNGAYMGNAFGPPRVAAPLSHGHGMNGNGGMMAVVPYMGGIPHMHSGGSTVPPQSVVRAPLTGTVGVQPGAPPVVPAEMLDLGPRGPRGDEPKPRQPLPPQPQTPPSPQPGAAVPSIAALSVRPPPPAYTPDAPPLSVIPLGNGGSAPTSGFDDEGGTLMPPGSTTSAAPATAIRTADLAGAAAATQQATAAPLSAPKSEDEIEFSEIKIEHRIGIGAFAEVFSGKWRGTEVAVKKLLVQADDGDLVREFRAECKLLRKLRHPNIIMFMAACTRPPNLCVVTELLSGSLFDLLHNSQVKLSWKQRLLIALDTAKGMNFLHLHKPAIIHRDLKSPNVLLDASRRAKVADFGLARSKAINTVMTGQCGTFQWMAPEVINNGRYSEKADIFSFAVILWELVAREVPYRDMNTVQVSVAVLTKGMRPTMPRAAPPEYAALINDCWHQDPERRPTFDYITDRLQAFLNNLSAFTASIPTATTPSSAATAVALVSPPEPNPPAYTEEIKRPT